ncbi:MAG: transposase [Thermoguttaceae bacterium]
MAERRLPHWSQRGTIAFITWRTWDSMPAPVIAAWLTERDALLRRHGIEPSRADWKACLQTLPKSVAREVTGQLFARWNDRLDALHGACVLRPPEIAQVVADSLCRFQGKRYILTDYVIMPNHVHLLAAFGDEDAMLRQCDSWKHYTAREINRALGRKGRFWQQNGFDHLVRSAENFDHYRRYIADNPVRARLKPGEFIFECKDLRSLDELPGAAPPSRGT